MNDCEIPVINNNVSAMCPQLYGKFPRFCCLILSAGTLPEYIIICQWENN